MGIVIHTKSGSGNSQGSRYLGTFTNWTALSAAHPTANLGDSAVTEDSEGTAWLPWTLGGTYYPQGTYYWDGVKWSSNVELIAEEIQEINDRIIVTKAVSINTAALVSDLILMTTGATDKTVTLPVTPVKDDVISVSKVDNGLGSCVVDGNGKNINGNNSITITKQYTSITIQYSGVEWVIK